jgi:hypothetical protein
LASEAKEEEEMENKHETRRSMIDDDAGMHDGMTSSGA